MRIIISNRMKDDWNERARKNARYYIAVDDWQTEERFKAVGIRDADMILSGIEPHFNRESIVLEIGCGIGRLLRPMTDRFKELYGVDVAGGMITQGREWLKDIPNIYLFETDGKDLSIFPDNKFDLCFSYITFQHIPSKEVIRNYMHETFRVLKDKGIFKFQVHGINRNMFRDRLKEFLRRKGTWAGVKLSKDTIVRMTRDSGFKVLDVYHYRETEQYLWVIAQK